MFKTSSRSQLMIKNFSVGSTIFPCGNIPAFMVIAIGENVVSAININTFTKCKSEVKVGDINHLTEDEAYCLGMSLAGEFNLQITRSDIEFIAYGLKQLSVSTNGVIIDN